MSLFDLLGKKKSILGVDIGTSNIKVVQISHKPQPVLETYGMVNLAYQLGNKNNENIISHMAEVLKTLISRAGVSARKCIISFPNSSVFTSVIELPKMSDKELNSAVEYEAKKYVPLSLSEIDLSWVVISKNPVDGMQKILLTAVPKQITRNYMEIFALAGFEPTTGEIEALALIRALIGSREINCVIIDIGAKSTSLNIIEKGFLRLSRNLNIGGETITNKISESLNVSHLRAEQFKKDFGVSGPSFIPETVKPILNIIKSEVKQLLAISLSQEMKVDKLILVGGGANLPGIADFFSDLNVPVELGDPLKAVGYNEELGPVLKRSALSLSIAIGLALRSE